MTLGRGRLVGHGIVEAGALGYVGGQVFLRGGWVLHRFFIGVSFFIAG